MKKIFFAALISCLFCTLCAGTVLHAAVITQDGSFENEAAGIISNATEYFSKDWVEKNGLGDPAAFVAEEDGNRYLTAAGMVEIQSVQTVQEPYTFSVDLRTNEPAADWMGIFIRTGDVFNLYEWDYYVEKGGTDGSSSIGGTGIVIYPVTDGIRLAVKTRVDGPWGIGSAYTDIIVEGQPDWKSFTNLRVEDDGSIVKIYVSNALAATVELSEKGTYPEDSGTEIPEFLDCVYYKNAVVKDAGGTERFRTDSARVVAEDCYLGIGIRTKSLDIDNISISKDGNTQTQQPDPTAKPTSDKKPDENQNTPKNPGSGDESLYFVFAAALLCSVILKRKAQAL